jgi:hypothetical protein
LEKATLFVIIILGIIFASISFFIFQPLSVFYYFNSSCASFGISKLTEDEIQQISNSVDSKNIMTLSDDDLKKVPKLLELIHKVSNKIRFNDNSRFTMTFSEMQQYHQYLNEKFEQQYGIKIAEYQKNTFLIQYNERVYVLGGFVFPNAEFPNVDNVELDISENIGEKAPKITLTDEDFIKIPKIKKAIEEIGIHEIQSHENIGMSENEWNQYRKWFDGKYLEGYSYFKYDDKIYSPSFGIC